MAKLFDLIAGIGERLAPISGKVTLNGQLRQGPLGDWRLEFVPPVRIAQQESSHLVVSCAAPDVEKDLQRLIGHKVQIKGRLATPPGAPFVLQASAIESLASDATSPEDEPDKPRGGALGG